MCRATVSRLQTASFSDGIAAEGSREAAALQKAEKQPKRAGPFEPTRRCTRCTDDWNVVAGPSLSTDGKRRAFERLLICTGTQAKRHDSLITVATSIARAASKHFRLPSARVPLEGEDERLRRLLPAGLESWCLRCPAWPRTRSP